MADEPHSEQVRGGTENPHLEETGSPLAGRLHAALEGAVFPLERERLVWVARENEAERGLLTELERLPARAFRSLDEVVEALASSTAPSPQES